MVARNYSATSLNLANNSTLTQYDVAGWPGYDYSTIFRLRCVIQMATCAQSTYLCTFDTHVAAAVNAEECVGTSFALNLHNQQLGASRLCTIDKTCRYFQALVLCALYFSVRASMDSGSCVVLPLFRPAAQKVLLLLPHQLPGTRFYCLHSVFAGAVEIPYTFVRGNSDYLYNPVMQVSPGVWEDVTNPATPDYNGQYLFAIQTISLVVLTTLELRCTAAGNPNSVCSFDVATLPN